MQAINFAQNEVQEIVVTCPSCGQGEIVEKSGKYGPFYACNAFPTCRTIVKAPQYKELLANAQNPQTETAVQWTPEQLEIFDWIAAQKIDARISLIVEACAGSGKTSTIKEAIKRVQQLHGTVLYLVFNKHNADEAIGKGLPAKTTHGHGYAAIKKYAYANGYKVAVKPEKIKGIYFDLMRDDSDLETPESVKYIVDARDDMQARTKYTIWTLNPMIRVIDLLKGNLAQPTEENILDILDFIDFSVPANRNKAHLIDLIQAVYLLSVEDKENVDFTDMIFMPVYYDMPVKKYDWCFVDEAQDMNNCQIELIKMTTGKRAVIIGDRNQSIYAFRGANITAMDTLKDHFNAQELSLSVTFRVPRAGVSLVNQEHSHINFNAFDEAIEGSVNYVDAESMVSMAAQGDMILCRVNAPLVEYCLGFIRAGIKATILGRDIGKQIATLIKNNSEGHDKVSTMLTALETHYIIESDRLRKRRKDLQAELLGDKVQAVYILSEGQTSVQAVLDRIDQIFSKDKSAITLSTIHKAKGLESENVWIVSPELMPHPAATRVEDSIQEDNMKYVALTRFQTNLYIVNE